MNLLFKVYRKLFSPALHCFFWVVGGNPHCGCRFEPTCSVYAEECVKVFGPFKGGWKAFVRLLRCHPFSGRGGYDPV
ncbi:MAG: membrane protein insertion efficiency factor YidD [Bdellovibrionales bacterium]|nr:membrane protein insertion efficiency factor YidD [Bdellovibrionales bacterium]